MPQSSASATENARMGVSIRMIDSAGKESGESNKGSLASQYDAATPSAAPVQEMTKASTSNWRTMRQRLAPIAENDTGQQKRERTPQIHLVRHDDGLQPEMPARDGMQLFDLEHDGLKRSIGGGHCDVRPQLDPW